MPLRFKSVVLVSPQGRFRERARVGQGSLQSQGNLTSTYPRGLLISIR